MDEKTALVIQALGSDGIQAFYVYLIAEYIPVYILVGAMIYGARIVWKKIKDDM